MELNLTPPMSPQLVPASPMSLKLTAPMSPASPMSPLSPILGALTIKDVSFELRALQDQDKGWSSSKRQREEKEEESPKKRAKKAKAEQTNWVSTYHPNQKHPKHSDLVVIGPSSTKIPWSGPPQEGAFLRATKKVVVKDKTQLFYYAPDCPSITDKKFKELLMESPEAIAYMVQHTAGGETFYVDGSESEHPSAKINHKWSPFLTNVKLREDGVILTTCALELFPGTSVELFMSYGDAYWYHRLCDGHELYEEDKDFDEISGESQEVLSAYMRVVLPDNVEKLTEEEQIVYMAHWETS